MKTTPVFFRPVSRFSLRRRELAWMLGLTLLWGVQGLRAAPVTTILAAKGQARMTIRVPSDGDAVVKRAARDLAEMLGRMAGTEFKVETGDVASGIVVARAADLGTACPDEARFNLGNPRQRDGYLLASEKERLWVVGATPRAVEHAAWDLLYRLGYRCYFPGPSWEIVPPPTETLSIAVHAREVPAFAQRRFFNASGSENPPEWLERWLVRNRARSDFDPADERLFWGYFLSTRSAQDEDSGRLGFSGSDRSKADPKHQYLRAGLCLSHAAQRRELIEYAVSARRRDKASRSVSATSGTAWNWCRCVDCRSAGPPVDRAVALANEIAARLETEVDDPWSVGWLVEGASAVDAPSHDLHPNVAPRLAAPTLLTLSYHESDAEAWRRWIGELAAPWRARQARSLSIGCRFGGATGVGDLSWTAVTRGIPALREVGFDGFVADIGQAWGDYGINLYLLSRLLWHPDADAKALVGEFLERCFGGAREPARRYFELAGGLSADAPAPAWRRSTPEAIASRNALLAEMLRLSPDGAVRGRIADLVLHTRLWQLRGALYRAADGGEREKLSGELMRLAIRARSRGMAPAREIDATPDAYASAGIKDKAWRTDPALEDEEILTWLEK